MVWLPRNSPCVAGISFIIAISIFFLSLMYTASSVRLSSRLVCDQQWLGAEARVCRPNWTVLLGHMGTGKTSLVLRFVKGQFSEYQESTIGAAFFTQVLSLNESTVKFDIWDTAGQERYHSLAPMYYRGAAAAIVVYDITSMDGEQYAKENGMTFMETSAKTAHNVNELFYEIAKRLAKANPSRQTGIKLHSRPQQQNRRFFCCG